jgi:hypothetical protein
LWLIICCKTKKPVEKVKRQKNEIVFFLFYKYKTIAMLEEGAMVFFIFSI